MNLFEASLDFHKKYSLAYHKYYICFCLLSSRNDSFWFPIW